MHAHDDIFFSSNVAFHQGNVILVIDSRFVNNQVQIAEFGRQPGFRGAVNGRLVVAPILNDALNGTYFNAVLLSEGNRPR